LAQCRFINVKLFSERTDQQRTAMAYSAAVMYGGAAFLGLVQGVTPGGPDVGTGPGVLALGFTLVLLAFGPRLPVPALATLGAIGAAVIAVALAGTHSPGDGALLYIWPVLWTSYFFGARGTILIVAWVGIVHGIALATLPSSLGYLDRWLDVIVSVGVVGAVVQALSRRNSILLDKLAAEARIDQLTDLLNRRGFEERAGIEIQRCRRENASVAVVSFDIDYFKRINDEWGHDAGDRVLARLGSIFLAQARGADVIARMGGEEFVALLPDSDLDEGRAYAERVRAAFGASGDAKSPRATVSAGVTAVVAPVDVDELVQVADTALYSAKHAGRDRTEVQPFGRRKIAVSQAAGHSSLTPVKRRSRQPSSSS
jgi:diguanylate cyclase (GGDEF)-like protein